MDAKNTSGKGDLELTLPPNASASINAYTRNGDIFSDYSMPAVEGESKRVAFSVGGGEAKVNLSTEVGDVRIKKGSGFPIGAVRLVQFPQASGPAGCAAFESAQGSAGRAGDAVKAERQGLGT